MISNKGLFYPISVISGNTMEFSIDFVIDGIQQKCSDYAFTGSVFSTKDKSTLASFVFSQNTEDENLIDVSLSTDKTRFIVGDHLYEIKAVNRSSAKVSTLLRGSFKLIETFHMG